MESIDEVVREIVREEIDRALEARLSERPDTRMPEIQVVVVDPRRLYSVKAAAELLDVSIDYVYQRIKANDLAVVELGHGRSKQRISVGELDRFIASRTYGPK